MTYLQLLDQATRRRKPSHELDERDEKRHCACGRPLRTRESHVAGRCLCCLPWHEYVAVIRAMGKRRKQERRRMARASLEGVPMP